MGRLAPSTHFELPRFRIRGIYLHSKAHHPPRIHSRPPFLSPHPLSIPPTRRTGARAVNLRWGGGGKEGGAIRPRHGAKSAPCHGRKFITDKLAPTCGCAAGDFVSGTGWQVWGLYRGNISRASACAGAMRPRPLQLGSVWHENKPVKGKLRP